MVLTSPRLEFVLVGPHKTGTSWSYEYLRRHGEVCVPQRVKETFFFNRNYDRGYDWYFSHFDPVAGARLGEVVPGYFQSAPATARLFEHNPRCTVVVTLREPLERLRSHYLYLRREGRIGPRTSFTETLAAQPALLDATRYWTHLTRWRDRFGPEQVHVLLYDLLSEAPGEFADRLCDRLEVGRRPISPTLTREVNAAAVPVNATLSGLVSRLTAYCRNKGLHGPVALAKRAGLKNLLVRRGEPRFTLSEADAQLVMDAIGDDMGSLERDPAIDISGWKARWRSYGIG